MKDTFGELMNDGRFTVQPFYTEAGLELAKTLPYVNFLDDERLTVTDAQPTISVVNLPSADFTFLHESAIIEYNGTLFAAWYSCRALELVGYTPIHGARSFDGGKTWTPKEIWAHDPNEVELYCPPAFGVCDGKLYMLVNTMRGFDNVVALELYCWNTQSEAFEQVWRKRMCFKMNTNVIALPNGKLMIPGRSGRMGENPLNPAVLISDSGKIDADWRIVTVDPVERIAPETTVIVEGDTLYMFSRSNKPEVSFVYVSTDYGETWFGPATHDLPMRAAKMYAGTLSDGRHYLVGNVDIWNRSKIALYLSEPHSCRFTKRYLICDTAQQAVPNTESCHYPSVHESDGRLYITLSMGYAKSSEIVPITEKNTNDYAWFVRGLHLFTLDVDQL